MCIKLKNDIPVCQRTRRLSCSDNPSPMKNSLVSMDVPLRTAYSQDSRCGMQPKAKHSLRAQAQLSESRTETVKTLTLEKKAKERKGETREVREQALPSAYHRQTYLLNQLPF
ncbi:hypothetical protein TNCV_5067331 [Trichonephila clavipes]|nr:hypothetical protein TNCV_5067331 [Trichonephila clavipes]